MADITQFVPPSWLEDQDAETIHARMMQSLPEDIDDTEGGFPWDFTKPAALEKAELLEFNLMETAKIMHYMFSYGIYLDYHAAGYGMERKGASYASGTVTVTGSPNTVIPAGFLFAVPASGDNAAITFSTLEEATISTDGTVDIPVQATEAGTGGNVAADTIVIMASPTIIGINRITNSSAITGGAAEEEDDALRQRIKERLESADASFVGCDADYKRWAKEVEGVGEVIVIPEWDGAGTVKVVVFDANGQPANAKTVGDVLDYIVSPDDRDSRKAPIGATVTIVAPTETKINVACNITFERGANHTTVIAAIKTRLNAYFDQAREAGAIKRNKIGSTIIGTDGVADYDTLLINDNKFNSIAVAKDEYPTLGSLQTEGVIDTTAELFEGGESDG